MKRYTRLTLAEREEISRHVAVGVSVRAMAQQLARSLTYDRGKEMAEHRCGQAVEEGIPYGDELDKTL